MHHATIPRPRRFLALAAAAVLVLTTTPLVAGAVAAAAEPDFNAGSGRADARVLRVGPSAGRLGLAPSLSLALADFLGTVGRGEALIAEYAALDGSVPEEVKDETPPVRVQSTDEHSDDGQSHTKGPFRQQARATDAPFGTSVSAIDSFAIPGLVTMSAGRAESWAGLVGDGDGGVVREAGGIVDIGRADFGGGAAVLNGLHWEVRQRTDENDDETPEVHGAFVVGSATIGDQRFDGPITGAALAPLFDALNAALKPTGLVVDVPVVSDRDAVARVTPLALRVVNSEVGRTVLGPVLGESQDLRDAIVTPFLEECPDCSVFVLVADVVVGVLSGSGRLDIEFGGAFGFTEGATFHNPFLDGGGFGLGAPPVAGTTSPNPATVSAPTAPVEPAAPAESSRSDTPVTTAPASPQQAAPPPGAPEPVLASSGWITSLASAVWAVGLIGFAGTAAMALAEYRRLRTRRLTVPV